MARICFFSLTEFAFHVFTRSAKVLWPCGRVIVNSNPGAHPSNVDTKVFLRTVVSMGLDTMLAIPGSNSQVVCVSEFRVAYILFPATLKKLKGTIDEYMADGMSCGVDGAISSCRGGRDNAIDSIGSGPKRARMGL